MFYIAKNTPEDLNFPQIKFSIKLVITVTDDK